MAKIPLTLGKFALVDDEDLSLVASRRWTAKRVNVKNFETYYAVCREDGQSVRMHRIIMDAKPGEIIDHKRHDTLDNRRSNLRRATTTQSSANRRGWGKSGFKGVIYNAETGRYRAYIDAGGKRIYLGYFGTESEAVTTRDDACRALHGEFAVCSGRAA